MASVAALVVIAAVTGWLLKPSPEIRQRPIQFYIKSDSVHQVMTDLPAISPDGAVVAYRGRNDDQVMLFQRRLDELESRPITGTEDGELPFFSPDGEWLGFWRNHTLLKTRLDGGMPLTIASGIGWGYDATWGPGDRIVFSFYPDTRPYQVSAGGGIAEPFLPLDTLGSGIWFSQPSFLPGGNAILFSDWRDQHLRLYVVDLETSEVRTLGSGAGAKFVESGHLVYGQADGSLILQPFDKSSLETMGQPTRLEWDASLLIGGWPRFDVSMNGTLVVSLRGAGRQLQFVDRAGSEHLFLSGHETWVPRFSPDGAFVAYGDVAEGESYSDVWVYNRMAGTQTRLTLDAGNASDPVWSPDGRFLAISNGEEQDLYVLSVDGGGEATLVLAREGRQWPSDWSNDGRFLVFTDVSAETGYDIWTLELDVDSVFRPFLVTDFNELAGVVSADGRWLAYQSDESGKNEVYVQSFPEPGHKLRVSADGGQHPVWSPDNQGLYYWSRGQLFEALVTAHDGLEFGDRQLVLQNQRYLHDRNL
jgi:serine/threonine-protein kinase